MPPLKSGSPFDEAIFDVDAARARLAAARGPIFWRGLEELADSDGFHHWLREQHPQLADTLKLDRRGFLKFLGASLALAGLAACGRPPQHELVPYVKAPDGQVAGLPRFFATALTRHGYAHGVLIENNMGRPTKVEGNPQHPASLGATDIFAQASVLQLWDPDRSQNVMHRDTTATWDDFSAAQLTLFAGLRSDGGAGLRVLTGSVTSPTLSAQLDTLLAKYPNARWHVHQPAGDDNAIAGTTRAFGMPLATRYAFDRAKIILALDADFLADPAAGVRYARDFAATRSPDNGTMSRLYAVESTPSLTGAMADHHLPLESSRLAIFARQLAHKLGGAPVATGHFDAVQTRWMDALIDDLRAHHGECLIVVGVTQPAELHALGHAMNAALGNIGTTIDYSEPVQKLPARGGSIGDLVTAMRAGSVETLLVIDANPAYDAPVDLGFVDALQRVPHLIHLGLYRDETGVLAEWHLPRAHELECWSDARAWNGTASIMQPLIAPLYGGRSPLEVLAQLLADDVREGRALVRRQWQQQLSDDHSWNSALRAGVIANTASPSRKPAIRADLSAAAADSNDDTLELLFRPDPTIDTGEWANNGWLQELPKPMTQLTWDNPALISPALATQYQLRNGDVIELHSHGRASRAAVWIMPGQAARSVTLHLGYGRRRAGHVGDGQGFDAYALRTSAALWSTNDLQLHKTGEHYELAATQHHFQMEGRDLLRVGALTDYLRDPHFATADDRWSEPTPSLYPDYPAGEYAWGMSIDLNACIGCKACTVACQAENNIPVVGKDQVSRGREMHWIRVDRYFEGDADNPRTYSQPVPCMMCEHAPCEVVCPVDATLHDAEGLNLQVYNRCVGTRFCSNNCPYKVRRFNFLQYVDDAAETLKAQRNPEVSVRRRGVMEKCTYCIQRIENAHIEADKHDRRIDDGDVVTACQAVCPTQAIRFGDIADKRSQVSQAKASPRNYALLGELGTRPRTSYLARLRNPNPALQDDPA